MIGTSITDFVSAGVLSPELGETRGATINEVVRTGRPVRFEDVRADMVLDNTYFPVFDDAGEVYRLAVFSRDITAQRRAEQLALWSDRLATIGRITAALTHEINNPLQALQTNLELLADFDPDPEVREDVLRSSIRLVERLATVTRDVLEFGLPGDDSNVMFDVGQAIEDAWTLMREHVRRAGIEAQICVPDHPPTVFGSPNAFAQVLVNLISNAVEAMVDGGRLHVRAAMAPDAVEIEIANDGPPMTAAELEHGFDPYYSTKPGHAGIGLWTTRRIVEAHHGTISAANRTDPPGVVFTIRLPRTHDGQAAGQPPTGRPE